MASNLIIYRSHNYFITNFNNKISNLTETNHFDNKYNEEPINQIKGHFKNLSMKKRKDKYSFNSDATLKS